MANCPSCEASYVPGTIFCDNCGFEVLSAAPAAATAPPSPRSPAPGPETAIQADTKSCPKCSRSVPVSSNFCDNCGNDFRATSQSPTLARLVLPTGEIVIPDKPEVGLGRPDPQGGWFPEIDLDPHGAYDKGVSRQHARLVKTADGQWSLIHNSQTNATRVNQEELALGQPRLLKDGDEIVFGNMRATFKLQ